MVVVSVGVTSVPEVSGGGASAVALMGLPTISFSDRATVVKGGR